MIINKQLVSALLLGSFFTTAAIAQTDSDIQLISNCAELQNILLDLNGTYVQTKDIDCSEDRIFTPIGDVYQPFTGSYNGNGYTISHLQIYYPEGEAGLFGYADGVFIENVHLEDVKVVGGDYPSAGLVGVLNNSMAFANSVSGTVHAGHFTGGLIGISASSSVMHNYAAGQVTGMNQVGGLVGAASLSKIYNNYAVNAVSGDQHVGGLVGVLRDNTEVIATYAIGAVEGLSEVGGLIGRNIDHSLVLNSFWDIETTGQNYSSGGLGFDTATMQSPATYLEWDEHAWLIEEGSYPVFAQ